MSNHPVLQLDQVYFEYEKTEAILRNLSFEITSKESVGIIGANGVGKSTIIEAMLFALYGKTRQEKVADVVFLEYLKYLFIVGVILVGVCYFIAA